MLLSSVMSLRRVSGSILAPRRCLSTLKERLAAIRSSGVDTVPLPVNVSAHRRQMKQALQEEDQADEPQGITAPENDAVIHSADKLVRRRRKPRKNAAVVDAPTNDGGIKGEQELRQAPSTEGARSAVQDIEPLEKVPVPHLAHGLDRVLFNPGVYYLQDPRSHVYNFDPYLQEITPVKDFNFDALTEYITSSRDPTLDELARAHELKVVGSTSSMTGVLSQFHFFISNWRPVNLKSLSSAFKAKSAQFTMSQRAPASIYLRHNNGIYAIDADKSLDSGETILSFLGRSMEKMLTLPPEEFSKLKKGHITDAPTEKSREAYHYSKLGSMLMRSQLDCNDPRLPGTGTFDLKTRAVLPVRMDVKNAHHGAGYQIFQSVGLLESFEREYYDMIRAAFLKYSLQVRIGKMDGIFVAYHNTERIFGFQYISLDEMDQTIHGSNDRNIAHREFVMSLKQLDKVLELAIEKFPGQSMALSFEASEEKTPRMNIVVEPLSEEEIVRRQTGELLKTLRAAAKNERINKMPSSTVSTNSKGTLEKMSNTLEQMIKKNNKKSKAKLSKQTQDQTTIQEETVAQTTEKTATATDALESQNETISTEVPASEAEKGTPIRDAEVTREQAATAPSSDSVTLETVRTLDGEDIQVEATLTTPENSTDQIPDDTPAPPNRIMFRLSGKSFVDGNSVSGPPQPNLSSSWRFQYSITEITSPSVIQKTLDAIRERQVQALTDVYADEELTPFKRDLKRVSELGRIKLERIKEGQTGSPVVFREGSTRQQLEAEYRKNFAS